MEIKTIGVVGAGTMGNGIAQVAAQAGFNVVMRDIEDRFVQGGIKNIDKFLAKSVENRKMTAEQKDAVMGRIKGTTKLEDLKVCDFVVEAVLEVMDLKKEIFKALEEITRPEVILSSIPLPCRLRRLRRQSRSRKKSSACTSSTLCRS